MRGPFQLPESHGQRNTLIWAEMALALRTSLITISGYAQQLARNHDPELATQLATDIAAEAKHLDQTIGGFLAETKKAKAASAIPMPTSF